MTRCIGIFAITLISFLGLSAQQKQKITQFSFFGGIQNPVEVAFIDLNSSGPADEFRVGPSFGMSIERGRKVLGIKASSIYLNNALKSVDWYQYMGSLHTSYNKLEATVRLNSSNKKVKAKLGLGAGILFQRTPSVFIKYDFITDDGLTEETFPAENIFTLALCGSLNFEIPINQRWSIISQFSSDGVLYYGEIETAILINANFGLGYNF